MAVLITDLSTMKKTIFFNYRAVSHWLKFPTNSNVVQYHEEQVQKKNEYQRTIGVSINRNKYYWRQCCLASTSHLVTHSSCIDFCKIKRGYKKPVIMW